MTKDTESLYYRESREETKMLAPIDIRYLQTILAEVGRWEHRGRSVSETYDMEHGAGSWRRALKAQ